MGCCKFIDFCSFFEITDPLYRSGFIQSASLPQGYNKNAIHQLANIPQISNGSSAYYNPVIQHQVQQTQQNSQNYYNQSVSTRNNSNQRYNNKQQQQQSTQQVYCMEFSIENRMEIRIFRFWTKMELILIFFSHHFSN